MATKFSLMNWLKTVVEGNQEDTDHVQIECSLVRALSEYRKKELLEICMDKDFEKRLMNRLEHIDLETVETYSYQNQKSFRFPMVFSVGMAVVAVVITFTVYNSMTSLPSQSSQIPTITSYEEDSFARIHRDDEALMKELKENPNNIRLLEKLETYYSGHGKKEQATEIHSMLETVSKRY